MLCFRSPELIFSDIKYLGLDGEKNLYFTFLKATEFIQSAVEQVIHMRDFRIFGLLSIYYYELRLI